MKKAVPFLPAALYYALVLYVSSRTVDLPFALPGRHGDKALHIVEFAVLGWLLAFGFAGIHEFPARRRAVSAFSTGAVLGILDEVYQSFVPGRQADIGDVFADAVGVAIGVWLFSITCRLISVLRRRRRRTSDSSASSTPT